MRRPLILTCWTPIALEQLTAGLADAIAPQPPALADSTSKLTPQVGASTPSTPASRYAIPSTWLRWEASPTPAAARPWALDLPRCYGLIASSFAEHLFSAHALNVEPSTAANVERLGVAPALARCSTQRSAHLSNRLACIYTTTADNGWSRGVCIAQQMNRKQYNGPASPGGWQRGQADAPRKKSSSPKPGWPFCWCTILVVGAGSWSTIMLCSPRARFGFEYVNMALGACFAATAADSVCALAQQRHARVSGARHTPLPRPIRGSPRRHRRQHNVGAPAWAEPTGSRRPRGAPPSGAE